MTYVRGRSIDCGRFAGSNLSHAILDDDSESDASLADLASPPYNVESQPLDSPTQSDDWTFGMEDEYLNHREIREIKEEEPGFEGDTSQDNSTGKMEDMMTQSVMLLNTLEFMISLIRTLLMCVN